MTNNTLSVRQLSRLLKKISLHDGDIVLIKQGKFDEKELLDLMRKGVDKMNVGSVLAIIVDDFEDITSLNRQEMNAHGWWHVDQINKLTGKVR